MYNCYNQNKEYNKHTNNKTKQIINSLDNPKAKVANRLSLSRIPLGLLVPTVAYFTKNQYLTLSLSSFYAISDFLDGFWAKHITKNPTEGGAYLDAACDKIGAVELIAGAAFQNKSLLINGFLEGIIAKININSIKNGNNVQSTKLGKIKMWPLSAALICTYASMTGFETNKFKISKTQFKKATNILIPITTALEIINIFEYYNMENHKENKTLSKK